MFGQFMECRVMTMQVSSLGRFTQLDIVGADISFLYYLVTAPLAARFVITPLPCCFAQYNLLPLA